MIKQNHRWALALCFALACTGLAQQAPPPAPPAPQTASPQAQPVSPPQSTVITPSLGVVVLDPGHGGTDAGARGASGIQEKDVAMALARALQARLEQQGFGVVLTRTADEDPSIDDRAALANAQRGAVFISLHVSSIGAAGTAMTFYLPPTGDAQSQKSAPLVRWLDAQQTYISQSRKLAELIQVQLGQKLRGSAEVPQPAAVRQLRSVTAPAVAVELNSVAVANRKPLDAAVQPLAEAVTRAVASFKAVYETGTL